MYSPKLSVFKDEVSIDAKLGVETLAASLSRTKR